MLAKLLTVLCCVQVSSFLYRPMAKPVLMDVQNTLRVTNFKMDRDLSKVDVFATTNDHYYQPKYLPLVRGHFLVPVPVSRREAGDF